MKYTEIIGEIKITYEGTAEEIMDLYNKMNPDYSIEYGQYHIPIKIPKVSPCPDAGVTINCGNDIGEIGEIADKVAKNIRQSLSNI